MSTATAAATARPAIAAELTRGAVGGVLAGAAFLVLNMWYATSTDMPTKMPIRMMSTIVQGDSAMMDGSASVGVGLVVHAVLSIVFGLTFAVAATRLRTNGSVALMGATFGLALYLVNFKVFAPIAFETFEDANQPFELAAHIVFGVIVAAALFSSGARRQGAGAVRLRGLSCSPGNAIDAA